MELNSDTYVTCISMLEKQLMELRVAKAHGLHCISNWVLHDVCAVFNSSIREWLPVKYMENQQFHSPSLRLPIQKKIGICPISRTCVMSKEFETHVMKWFCDIVLP